MSSDELTALFHHRWSPPVLALLGARGGVRFVELQRKLGAGGDSLRRALDHLIELGYVQRNEGYGHALRPEYLLAPSGRDPARVAAGVLRAGPQDVLLRKWSVPVLAAIGDARRFSELRADLVEVSPRALALSLQDLEAAGLVTREVLPTRPPTTAYRATAAGRRVQRVL